MLRTVRAIIPLQQNESAAADVRQKKYAVADGAGQFDSNGYCATQPPSMENPAPVTKLEALLAR
jgi:hypothetical protein